MQALRLNRDQLQHMIGHVDLHAPFKACRLLAEKNTPVEKGILSPGWGGWQAREFWLETDVFHEVQLQIE